MRNSPDGEAGVLVAADERVEWLLPWWYTRFRAHNPHPIAFIDLGMSHFGRTFCEQRGRVLALDAPMPTFQADKWVGKANPFFFENRKRWMLKPLLFLHTPFKKTLWLDLDCEVLAPLQSLFSLEGELWIAEENSASLVWAKERQLIEEGEILYNSGVIVYEHGSSLIEKWAEAVVAQGEEFWSDQEGLSYVLRQEKRTVGVLGKEYNWRMTEGLHLGAKIVHWVGSWGKEYIRLYGGVGDALASLPQF